MTTIHDLLEQYASLAPDTRAKGLYLERLVKRYFETEPWYQAQFENVWLWQEWPGRGNKPDTGIDLVAERKYGKGLTAIQCKFYAPSSVVQKGGIDSFISASNKAEFTERIVVSTTDKWSKNALDTLDGLQPPLRRLGLTHLAESVIDWSSYRLDSPEAATTVERKKLRPHQIEALQDVVTGLDERDRGQLIMACGTGKTFTGLRIAERIAGPGRSVLFLVPSIALLAQTLREWTQQADVPLRSFAICSDSKLGRDAEDLRLRDLEIGATTNADELIAALAEPAEPGAMTVFFSTYQSIEVVAAAQRAGVGDFDLILCDEAHRTAGVIDLATEKVSPFVRVHDQDFVRGDKRLYMTATPKLYGDSAKKKADEASVEIASMDRDDLFGPELHRLGFGKAVEQNLLTDYKVLVLAVSEDAVTEGFQKQFAEGGVDLNIPDAARVAGIYKALSKTAVEGLDENSRNSPMRRAVAFASSIHDSQRVTEMLDDNAALSKAVPRKDADLVMESKHVDGTMDILQRGELLAWLEGEPKGNRTRILTNARCLTEGVDVPSLDAVIFLNPRGSQIDVVQAVGRVMRRAEGKDYGYIILPVAVPAGVTPEEALDDNERFRVIWEVLQALRAHDERFAATIEAIRLNPSGSKGDQIQVISTSRFLPSSEQDEAATTAGNAASAQVRLDFAPLGPEWDDAIFARIVKKVGVREYWENWAKDVADVASRQRLRVEALLDTKPGVRREFERFVKGLRGTLNESITDADALDMLAQHIITEPVLEILFEGYSFAESNAVASAMERMLTALEGTNVDSELRELDTFYEGVKRSVGQIKDAQGKQRFLKQLYERFFRLAMTNASERLGIVYTPNEIVDFILRSADELSREHFGKGLADEGVHILDPFTGTGTFLAQLILDPDLMPGDKLPYKFRNELWANEISLLAYYVAAVNLEQAYQSRMGGNYVAFPHIALTDTFQNTEPDDQLDPEVFEQNSEVVAAEMDAPISVIIGNPPYSRGKKSGNDMDERATYPALDLKIASTYVARSKANLKNSMYDSYIRAIRWSSDRVGARGIVAFVSNGGFIDSNTADGLRKTLAEEFSEIYVANLRGNANTSGSLRRDEGGNVFAEGTRTSVAILILVKGGATKSLLNYWSTPAGMTRGTKLALLSQTSVSSIRWDSLAPNDDGDWINQRGSDFARFDALSGDVFDRQGLGVSTNRDAWVYSSDLAELRKSSQSFVSFYNSQVGLDEPSSDPTRISWSARLLQSARRGRPLTWSADKIRPALYRPYVRQHLYADPMTIERPGILPSGFPSSDSDNVAILTPNAGEQGDFAALATRLVPDLHVIGSNQVFSRFSYQREVRNDNQLSLMDDGDPFAKQDNVTDGILANYRARYADQSITKDDIFWFVYGILHSSEYRTRFAADLKRTLPRIPQVGDFWAFANAGKELADIHVNYESADLYPLGGVPTGNENLRVEKKMAYGGKRGVDKTTLHYNDVITLTGIPERAHEYKLGSRSALDWIVDRYYVRVDKASGIVNDANAWGEEHGNPRYILELIQRIVTVSLRTVDIVESLPPLDIPSHPSGEAPA